MIEALLIGLVLAAVIFSLVRPRDGRESRPVSLESPSASRVPREERRLKR